MGKLLDLAKAKSATIEHKEYDTFKVIIDALVPQPKGDLYESTDEEGVRVIKPLQLIDEADRASFKFYDKNYLIIFRPIDENGKVGDAVTSFVTGNRITNPVTAWSDVKAIITMNGFTRKDGTDGAGIASVVVSFDNIELMLKHNNGALFNR